MVQQLISFKEAREYLGLKAPATLRSYIHQGLPVVVIGKSKKIDVDDLKKFIKDHKEAKAVN